MSAEEKNIAFHNYFSWISDDDDFMNDLHTQKTMEAEKKDFMEGDYKSIYDFACAA